MSRRGFKYRADSDFECTGHESDAGALFVQLSLVYAASDGCRKDRSNDKICET